MPPSVAVIGQSQSGKSSLVGTIKLTALGHEELHHLCSEKGAPRSWYSDTLEDERQRSLTIESKKSQVSVGHQVTVIDTPGNRQYLPSMIRGTAQADCAMLTVSALSGEFEDGLDQTREHALIAFTLGLRQMIVVVTKMDRTEPAYSEDRFNEVKEKVGEIISKLRYKLEEVPFVPVSAEKDENVVSLSELMPWYEGLTYGVKDRGGSFLLEALGQVHAGVSSSDGTLRFCVDKVDSTVYGTTVSGRVETGSLLTDSEVTFAPQNLSAVVSELRRHYEPLDVATAGDIVQFIVKDVPAQELKEGSVAGQGDTRPREASSFIARVRVEEHGEKMALGYTPTVHCHAAAAVCRFEELLLKVDGETKQKQEKPTSISNGDFLTVRLVPTEPMVVEAYSECRALGGVVMSDQGHVVAVGIVDSVEKIVE